jgi:hypothetical protein
MVSNRLPKETNTHLLHDPNLEGKEHLIDGNFD